MGAAPVKVERLVAFVRCSGGDKTYDKYHYEGINNCAMAAAAISGGQRSCAYGCLGYGDCVKVCQHGAISIAGGVALIDREKCRGCMKCISVCPKRLIIKVPYSAESTIACANIDRGGLTRNVCQAGAWAARYREKLPYKSCAC
jgi:ferredoxin